MCSTMKESLRAAVVNGAWIERTVLVPCVLGQMKSLRHNEIFANNFASLFFAGLICVLCMLKIIPNAYTKTDKVHTLPVSCKLTVANISPSTQAHLNIKSFNIIYELHKNSQSLIFNEKVAERARDRDKDRERESVVHTDDHRQKQNRMKKKNETHCMRDEKRRHYRSNTHRVARVESAPETPIQRQTNTHRTQCIICTQNSAYIL